VVKFLIDTSTRQLAEKASLFPDLVGGQLLTPLTRYADAGGQYAIDNGAFSGFDRKAFSGLLERQSTRKDRCLFVCCPDIVSSARRTLELWQWRHKWLAGWPAALVAQDGIEDFDIPWCELSAIFIGGGDPWKDSKASMDVVKTAKTIGVHVHIGRVNEIRRYRRFAEIGADTCDGSGIARFDHMLERVAAELGAVPDPGLFDSELEELE
jgi:hypothetical protein